jgi:hypothetical protein
VRPQRVEFTRRKIACVIFGAIGEATKAANDATGHATTNARAQSFKKSGRHPRFNQVMKAVMMKAMMPAMTTG